MTRIVMLLRIDHRTAVRAVFNSFEEMDSYLGYFEWLKRNQQENI